VTAYGTSPDPLRPVGAFPLVIPPDRARVFSDRSRRLAVLAEDHPLRDWLLFLARLTEIQHELLQECRGAAPVPGIHGLPPIPASSLPRDPSWRQALSHLTQRLAPHAPGPARDTLEQIQAMDGAALEALADLVLRAELDGKNANLLPFVAAALQVHWTALAAGLGRPEITPSQSPEVCPCCGFQPVAGIVRTGGEVERLRYLHCGLCNTEWNLVRVTCAACRSNDGVAYFHIEGTDGSVRAETCDACKSYLKIVYQEKSPAADPVADDLASLALDLLVQEAGYDRIGVNLLLSPSNGTVRPLVPYLPRIK